MINFSLNTCWRLIPTDSKGITDRSSWISVTSILFHSFRTFPFWRDAIGSFHIDADY